MSRSTVGEYLRRAAVIGITTNSLQLWLEPTVDNSPLLKLDVFHKNTTDGSVSAPNRRSLSRRLFGCRVLAAAMSTVCLQSPAANGRAVTTGCGSRNYRGLTMRPTAKRTCLLADPIQCFVRPKGGL